MAPNKPTKAPRMILDLFYPSSNFEPFCRLLASKFLNSIFVDSDMTLLAQSSPLSTNKRCATLL
jgi:hypothetical protein